MSDRPILFSASMIRALLDGTKTQTRRVWKLPTKGEYFRSDMGGWAATTIGGGKAFTIGRDGSRIPFPEKVAIWNQTTGTTLVARYQPGDRLWVRETWAEHHPAGIQPDRFSRPGRAGIPGPPGVSYRVIYRADGDPIRVWNCDEHPYRTVAGPRDDVDAAHPSVCSEFPGWSSPLFMPRWASRLTLTVTDVRVQRLHDIDADDAGAEGLRYLDDGPAAGFWIVDNTPVCGDGTVDAYAQLWEHINGAGSWDANPWIVALTFTVERRNIDEAPPP